MMFGIVPARAAQTCGSHRFALNGAQHRAQQETAARQRAAAAAKARAKAIRRQEARAVVAAAERARERKALRATSPASVHRFRTSQEAAAFVLAALAKAGPAGAAAQPGGTAENTAAFILAAAAKARPNRNGA